MSTTAVVPEVEPTAIDTPSNTFESFSKFVAAACPTYRFHPYTTCMIDTLNRVAEGCLKRVVINTPPRSGLSLTMSHLFASYLQHRAAQIDVQIDVGIFSYSSVMAIIHANHAKRCFKDSAWNLDDMTKKGVGEAFIGHPLDVAIIDSPYKNVDEARSYSHRLVVERWYEETLLPHLKPDAAIVVGSPRFYALDFTHFVLNHENGEAWTVLNFPALKHDNFKVHSRHKVLDDGRVEGEPLVMTQSYFRQMHETLKSIDLHKFETMYQQNP